MNDRRDNIGVELAISEILRWGVRCSLFLIVVGTLLCFLHTGEYGNSAENLKKLLAMDSAGECSLAIVWSGILHLQGAAVIVAGLALLIATPIFRVVASIAAFAIVRDWVYVAISAAVLTLVAVSFALGSVG
jgi:uncharacterized membrane protein